MPTDPSGYLQGAFGQELTAAGSGPGQTLQDHSVPGIWVKVTGAPDAGRHPFRQVVRKASGEGWDELAAGPGAAWGEDTAESGPLRTPDGSELAVDTVVYAVQDPAHPDGPGWLAVGTGGAATPTLYVRITGGTDPGPYTGVVAVQDSPGVFADKVPTTTVEDIYRRPSNLTTPDIAVGQHVECWPSPTVPGTYEAHPWGAMQELTSSTCLPITLSVTCAPGGFVIQIDGVNVTGQIKARDLKRFDLTSETPCP